MLTAGRGTSGGATNWSSGFLPTTYQGVLFRNQGEPVLNLANPPGLSAEHAARQTSTPCATSTANGTQQIGDPEIASRIAAYELAFRMQAAAPELIDLSERDHGRRSTCTASTARSQDRRAAAAAARALYRAFATNCLLARRLVERGVRFVNLYHASWDHHSNLDARAGASTAGWPTSRSPR